MEERLKKLRRAMNKTTFKQVDFTEEMRHSILGKINKQEESDEDILLAVLQLASTRKTGFELTNQLRSRGISRFEEHEGFLYTMLHRLEQKGYLTTSWENESKVKYYCINNKGRKLLRKVEAKDPVKRFEFKELWEG